MQNSQEEWDIYTGNIEPYVRRRLETRFSSAFTKSLPVCSSVNVLKKMVDQKASVYKAGPERNFTDVSDEQKEILEKIYRDAGANFQMQESNRLFELQKQQTHVMIEPKGGKLTIKPIKAHQLNVKPSIIDPEIAEVYILSAYNKDDNEKRTQTSDGINQKIADQEDYKKVKERYIWWSKSFHFVTNGKAEILSNKEGDLTIEDIANPIGIIPIVEISQMKDFTYWREITNDVAEFTVSLNDDLTMLQHIVELQGFSQAYLKGPADLLPKEIQVGPSKILKLVTDSTQDGDVEFGYATPSSDVNGSMDFFERKLAMFLSSQGVNPSTVSGKAESEKFTSGTDRLLANIEKMESSRDTALLYKDAEAKVYQIIKAWYNALIATDRLDPKYRGTQLSEDSSLEVKFAEPSIIMSEIDKLDYAERMKDLGAFDDADVNAYMFGISREAAIELMKTKSVNNSSVEQEVIVEEDDA